MKQLLFKTLWAVLIAAVALGLALELRPQRPQGSRLGTLPLQGFGLNGRDLPLSESEASFYRQVRVVKRLYQAGDARFTLLAVDGANDRHVLHDPLYCFRGAGWEVTGNSDVPMPGGQGRRVRLAKGTRSVEAMYWFSDGRQRHTSALRLWWQSVVRRVGLQGDAGTPALLLLQPVAGTTVNWHDLPTRFPQLFTL